MFRPPPLIASVAFILMALAVSTLVYVQALRGGYAALADWADARLSQYNDRLLGQVSRYQQLANTIARHPDVLAAVEGRTVSPDLSAALSSFALKTGAQEIFIVDADGALVESSETISGPPQQRQGDLRRLDYVRTALDGGLGWSLGLENRDDPRTIYVARAIFAGDGPVIGAVAIAVAVRKLELEWSFGPEPVAFFDRAGIAFITNRPDLALRRDPSLSGSGALPKNISEAALRPFFDYRDGETFGHRIWTDVEGGTLPRDLLVFERFVPRVQLTSLIFQDTRPTEERALLLATLAAMSCALLGVLLWAANLRREALARQLQQEEEANAMLEARVLARTEELRQAQDKMVAVNRLSALGEMSAGISHELNQPLGAIRNFAENGKKLLELGRNEAAAENFDHMSTQVDRIGRIIRSLRAFARNEPQEIADVDLAAVTKSALAVSDLRRKRENVDVATTGLDSEIRVAAGEVRLQQVLVNILNNAMDALSEADTKRIEIMLEADDAEARLAVRDSGPGIAAPDRVFDPFYSTKDPGGSSGMGLGLSISHGIIGSFGGRLTCRNRKRGGAEFVIALPRERRAA